VRNIIAIALFLASTFETVLGQQDGDWIYSVENNEAIITSYVGAGGAVMVPGEVNSLIVKKIGNGSLVFNSENTVITSITIPNSVTNIGNNAFVLCRNLTNVTMGNNVTSIGDSAFASCESLISITIPSSVTSIGKYAFSSCDKLANVNIPSSVSNIKEYTFSNCAKLTSVTIPNSVTNIGDMAFIGCSSLTGIIIPNSVTGIGQYSFSACTNLTSAAIGNGVTVIGDLAFWRCANLTNITIPSSVTRIGNGAFFECSSLSSITIPDSVISIGKDALGFTSLTNIILPQRFMADYSYLGISGQLAANKLVLSLANTLATNTTFINNLAQAIIAVSNNYGLATQSAITTATSTLVAHSEISTLATKTELTNALAQSRTDGINSVLSNPNLWTLYTTNQIKAMVMGDLMLTRTNNGQFVLNYDIEQSDDLTNWSPYQGFALPLTNLPTDKAFVRIRLKNQQ